MKAWSRPGFTLIELLIVIAIIAVLSVVVILSLNPAELLRQSRDSNRLSDMATTKSAIALYLADQATPYLGLNAVCYASVGTTSFATVSTSGVWTAPAPSANCENWFASATTTVQATTTQTIGQAGATQGNGWIPVNFANISSGSPIGQEPIDPVNSGGNANCGVSGSLSDCSFFYSYITSGTSFKLATFMESLKYSHDGSANVTINDGGINPYVFESGTNPAL